MDKTYKVSKGIYGIACQVKHGEHSYPLAGSSNSRELSRNILMDYTDSAVVDSELVDRLNVSIDALKHLPRYRINTEQVKEWITA